jgi:formylglycine-generating enzyme required for sulfatase activity
MADAARSRDLSAEAVEEALLWRRIADSGRVEELERYLSTYGEEGLFTRLARSHLARLKSAPRPAPTAAKPRIVEPALVEVPPGSFLMGSPKHETDGSQDERPAHQVTFAKPFAIGRAPVSFAEYDAFCEATGRDKPRDEGWGRDQRPVIHVTWEDANAYCGWLARETGRPYRLPAEAEWERAARAGSTASYPWGNTWDQAKANGAATAGGTTEPGAYPPNAFGLLDMIGNVWEWCADPLHDDYRGAPADGSVWSEDGDPVLHVIRGGSWDDLPQALRSAMRGWFKRDEGSLRLGFRVARDA